MATLFSKEKTAKFHLHTSYNRRR